MLFFERFFGKSSRKFGAARRRAPDHRKSANVSNRLRMEPLEDRSLLSINPGFYLELLPRDRAGAEVSASISPAAQSDAGSRADWWFSGGAIQGFGSSGTSSTAVATHYVAQISPGVTSGNAVTVELLAEDVNNHLVPSYSGTADLTSSDGSATLPATVTFNDGRATFQVTFATAGQQSVTATDEADTSITDTVTTNVATPDVATHFVITLPSGATTGTAVTGHIIAEDAQNFVVRDYTGTVDFTSSDAAATLPSSITFTKGQASFQVTFATAAPQTVTATDSADSSLTGTATSNVVAPDVATHFAIYLTQGATTGSGVTVKVVAEDAQNHFVSNYAGTANVTSSDPGATVPASVTFTNGQATFRATFATAGQQTLTVTDNSNAALTSTADTNVSAAHFVLQLPQGVSIGSPVSVHLLAEDGQNHLLSTYTGTANLTSSDSGATLPATVTFANGQATFQVTFATAGAQTVTATDSANASPIGTASTNVAAAAVATHFVVYLAPGTTTGTPVTVRVVAEDAQNHLVTNYAGTVNVTSSDASATLPATVTFTKGQATFFQATFNTAGEQTITLTDSANGSLTGTASTNVATPAAATHFVLLVRPGVAVGTPTTVQIIAEDAENHLVSNYSGTVDLSSSDGGATLPASVTFTNGRARLQVTFATTGPQAITATDSANATVTGTATTNVANEGTGGRGGFGRFGFDFANPRNWF